MEQVTKSRMPRSVVAFVVSLSVGAIVLGAVLAVHDAPLLLPHWPSAAMILILLAAAERLDVRFRLHGQVESLNLTEAIVAPMIFAFQAPIVMIVVVAAQLLSGFARQNEPIKVIFNSTQWAVAAGLGSVVYTSLANAQDVSLRNIGAMLLAMVVAGIVNQVALTTVLTLAQRHSTRNVLRTLSPVIVPGWLIGWALNTLIGLLFVLAYASSVYAVVLFWVPLVVLHAAYRGYAGMESDRMRLAGLHRASHRLGAKDDLDRAMAGFLAEMCRCFESEKAELWLVRNEEVVVYAVRETDEESYTKVVDNLAENSVRVRVCEFVETTRLSAKGVDELSVALRDAGLRDALVTPLPNPELMPGVLAVFDQNGLEGFEEGEYAVLEALARETMSSFEKGRLSAAVVQERHKLSQIVDSTYDGVLTLTGSGVVRTWNPGWEAITGYSAYAVVGRKLSETITLFDLDGHEVRLDQWRGAIDNLPKQLQMLDRTGVAHWLECSYRTEVENDESGDSVLAVVAHDMSDVREIEQLREDVDRLAELEAVQRNKVLQLQESLQPAVPEVATTEFGVYYQPSDTSAPTGGDFYDWQVLPGGDVHFAVVDVLGHGIEATNDAFAMIHLLRTLAFQGTPVERLVVTADDLIASFNSELVVTVMCGRYRPSTGACRLAGGGHPPPLLIHPDGKVDEIAVSGIPVGWPGAGSDQAVDIILNPSDTLVLYTDGLVEAQRDILLGLEMLAENASKARDLAAPELARALVELSLEGAARRDDTLALVIRNCGVPNANGNDLPGFGVRSVPHPEEVASVRHRFLPWAVNCGLSADQCDDLAIALSELASNAVRVASTYFEVRVAIINERVVVEVEDDGPGFMDEEMFSFSPDVEDESGRGLFIVRTLLDEVSVRSTGRGCVVRASVAVENAREPAPSRPAEPGAEMLATGPSPK